MDAPPLLYVSLLIILIFAAGIIIFLVRRKSFRIYKAKGPYLLSAGEKRFFDALGHSINNDVYICPKVRIADLVEVDMPQSNPKFWGYLGKISQKHVDFVLCKATDFSPVLVIELDGGSHHDAKRTKRDAFVDSVFESAGIPIIHIPIKSFYPYNELRGTIDSIIRKIPG